MNYFYIKPFWVLAQNLTHWAITAPSGMWNWLRHGLGQFFPVLKAGDRKWVKWWMMSMLVGVFVEDSGLSSLLCSKAQDYPKTACSTKPICSQRKRLSLCIKKGSDVRFLSFSLPSSPPFLRILIILLVLMSVIVCVPDPGDHTPSCVAFWPLLWCKCFWKKNNKKKQVLFTGIDDLIMNYSGRIIQYCGVVGR